MNRGRDSEIDNFTYCHSVDSGGIRCRINGKLREWKESGNGYRRKGAGWIEYGGRFPKNLRPGKRAHDSMRVNHGMISSMETSEKIMEKNELDLMQKKNQQRGIDRKAKPDIVSIMRVMDSPAEPDLS